MIHLGYGKDSPVPASAMVGGDHHTHIVGDHDAVGVFGIDPHVVVIASPADQRRCFASIVGNAHAV